MAFYISTYLKHFYIPIMVFFAAIFVSVYFNNLWTNYDELIVTLPYVLFIAGGLVAYYLLQYAIVYTTILFAFTYALIQLHLQTTLTKSFTFSIFVFANGLFPLLLVACVLFGKKTLTSLWSIGLLVVCSSLLWMPSLIEFLGFDIWLASLPKSMFNPFHKDTWFSFSLLITYIPVIIFLSIYYFLNPIRLHALWIVGLISVLNVFIFFSTPMISAITFSVFSLLVLVSLLQEVFALAFTDELTGIASRKALEKKLLGLGRHYSIAMIDVDHFKRFNDTYGHDVGDQVLKMVASKINKVSGGGKAYRYGGEEFIILFPAKTMNESLKHLEWVRTTIANYNISLRDNTRPKDDKIGIQKRVGKKPQGVHVTVSIGVSQYSDKHRLPDQVIKVADQSLYRAKQSGRNCIRVA